ncbi:MAG: thiamine phosphate synthase [Sphingosinicella sp.]|nr:thiamine phosphate synthase [Sphingosinicella sp.]
MYHRQSLPRLWMMTDERLGDELFPALQRLPRGAGIVFRHYSLDPKARRKLFLRVRKHARARGLQLMLAGSPQMAEAWGADGSHGPAQAGSRRLPRSASVHNRAELRAAERGGADFIFVSPVFQTRSHPGADALGPVRFGLLAGRARSPVIALGGMNAVRARRLAGFQIWGWGAIDAWNSVARLRRRPV